MVLIVSYLKQGAALVPAAEFRGPFEDPDYIEGALVLTIDHTPLLTLDQVDLLDQLWAYLIEGMVDEVDEGRPLSTYFPGCPIQVELRPVPSRKAITVSVDLRSGSGPRSGTTPMAEFKRAFCAEARRFLRAISPLAPSHRATYERLLSHLETIA